MLKYIAPFICGLLLSFVSHAEQATRILIQTYQPPILGKDSTLSAEKFDTVTIWIGEHRAIWDRTRSDFRFITYNDSSRLLLLRPKFEIFQVFERPGAAERDSAATLEDDLAMGLGQLRQVEVWSITPTGDTSTVRNVRCHRFEFVMKNDYGEQLEDVWISDDPDDQIPAFHLAYHGLSFYLDGHESIESALTNVHGYPMLKISRGRVRRTEEIIAIDTVSVDSRFFEIPASYEEYE